MHIDALEAGIRSDGTVEDCDIETFFQPLEYVEEGDGFLRVVSDGPGYNTETRVPHLHLVRMGWTPPADEAPAQQEGGR